MDEHVCPFCQQAATRIEFLVDHMLEAGHLSRNEWKRTAGNCGNWMRTAAIPWECWCGFRFHWVLADVREAFCKHLEEHGGALAHYRAWQLGVD